MKNKKIDNLQIEDDDETKTYMLEGMSIRICAGTLLGAIVGVLIDNISICICFGTSIGLCAGLIIGLLIKKDK